MQKGSVINAKILMLLCTGEQEATATLLYQENDLQTCVSFPEVKFCYESALSEAGVVSTLKVQQELYKGVGPDFSAAVCATKLAKLYAGFARKQGRQFKKNLKEILLKRNALDLPTTQTN